MNGANREEGECEEGRGAPNEIVGYYFYHYNPLKITQIVLL